MRKYTSYLILTVFLLVVGYDMVAYNLGGPKSTISWVIYEWSENSAFSFGVGFLCGHLFWQMKYFRGK